MKKIIIAIAALLTALLVGAQNTSSETKTVQYHFFTNNIPSDWNYPLIGFVNKVDGNHASVQVGIVNTTSGNFGGVQGGFINKVGGNVVGMQSGFFNRVEAEFQGIQNGFINKTTANFSGIQTGFIDLNSKNVYGIQSGFVNASTQSVYGLQCGFVNRAVEIRGLQYGYINRTKTLRGVQLGFINSVDHVEKGLPIGFMSFVKNGGYKAIEVSSNSIYPLNIAFKTGIRKFYTYPMVAYDWRLADDRVSFGWGVGSNLDLGKAVFINPEIDWLHQVSMDFNHYTNIKCNFGFTIADKIELLAGPALVWHFKINEEDFHENYTEWDPDIVAINDVKIGWNVALRYKF